MSELKRNLIFIGVLDKSGYTIRVTRGKMKISNGAMTIMRGSLKVVYIFWLAIHYVAMSPQLHVHYLMQSEGMTFKTTVKVPKREVLRAEGKKIKDALNKLIQVLEESRCIWDVF